MTEQAWADLLAECEADRGRLREQLAESEAANESFAVEAKMAREQLDAARQALTEIADTPVLRRSKYSPNGYADNATEMRDRARAALGVVGGREDLVSGASAAPDGEAGADAGS